MTFFSPCWRSLNPLKGSLNHPNFESPGRCSFFSPFFGIFQLRNLNAPAGFAAFAKPQDSIQCISDGILGKNTLESGDFSQIMEVSESVASWLFRYQHAFAASTYYEVWVINAFVIIHIYVQRVCGLFTRCFSRHLSLKELSLLQFVNLCRIWLFRVDQNHAHSLWWYGQEPACGGLWIGMDGRVFRGKPGGHPHRSVANFSRLQEECDVMSFLGRPLVTGWVLFSSRNLPCWKVDVTWQPHALFFSSDG